MGLPLTNPWDVGAACRPPAGVPRPGTFRAPQHRGDRRLPVSVLCFEMSKKSVARGTRKVNKTGAGKVRKAQGKGIAARDTRERAAFLAKRRNFREPGENGLTFTLESNIITIMMHYVAGKRIRMHLRKGLKRGHSHPRGRAAFRKNLLGGILCYVRSGFPFW